jgi:hypothetical protein
VKPEPLTVIVSLSRKQAPFTAMLAAPAGAAAARPAPTTAASAAIPIRVVTMKLNGNAPSGWGAPPLHP